MPQITTPKTNWTENDYFNVVDYNRIAHNIIAIYENLSENNLVPKFNLINEDDLRNSKNYDSLFLASEMNAIEENIDIINTKTYQLDLGKKKTYKANAPAPDYEEFNRIESAIFYLNDRVLAQVNSNTAPTIEITSDLSEVSNYNYYDVEGIVTASGNGIGEVSIYYENSSGAIESKKITLDSEGHFTVQVPLYKPVNDFTIRATDTLGNPRLYEFSKEFDNIPPTLVVTVPNQADGSNVYIEISGVATDSQSGLASVIIDGYTVQHEQDGTFKYGMYVNTDRTIVVKAVDNAGRSTTKNVYAKRSAQAVYRTEHHSSGLTGWHDKYGTTAAPYCDHCMTSWGSPGHCTWTTTVYDHTNYWFNFTVQ